MTMPHPLRVAIVARAVMPLHGVGGLERSVHDLVRHLAARDVRVTLITQPRLGPAGPTGQDPFSSTNIDVRYVPYVTFPGAGRRGTTVIDRSTAYPLFGWRAGHDAASLVRDGQIDLVHGFGASVLGYAHVRSQLKAPLVFNPQGLEEFGATASSQGFFKRVGYAPLRAAVRACATHADRIIATDRALKPTVVRHLAPRPGQVVVIPNGIDVAALDAIAARADGAAMFQRHGVALDEIVFVSVGRLEANKGFDRLAEALGHASAPGHALHQRPWRWVLAGAGPFARDIESAIDQHGIRAHTLMLGRTSDLDLHAWYDAATIFVHPSLYEGSSIVTLEAMAHRKPVVATRAGGLPDKVHPGVNGWLVAPGDSAALAAAIEDAVSDPARLAAMGSAGRDIVVRDFAWDAIANRHIALYQELLS